MTCYNEDGDELRRTLTGIASNLQKLAKAGLHVRSSHRQRLRCRCR